MRTVKEVSTFILLALCLYALYIASWAIWGN